MRWSVYQYITNTFNKFNKLRGISCNQRTNRPAFIDQQSNVIQFFFSIWDCVRLTSTYLSRKRCCLDGHMPPYDPLPSSFSRYNKRHLVILPPLYQNIIHPYLRNNLDENQPFFFYNCYAARRNIRSITSNNGDAGILSLSLSEPTLKFSFNSKNKTLFFSISNCP